MAVFRDFRAPVGEGCDSVNAAENSAVTSSKFNLYEVHRFHTAGFQVGATIEISRIEYREAARPV